MFRTCIQLLLPLHIPEKFPIPNPHSHNDSRLLPKYTIPFIQKVIMKDVIVESLSGILSTILIVIVSILVVTYYVDSSIDKSYIIVLTISL